MARRTRPVRAIEREHARLNFPHVDAALGTRKVLTEKKLFGADDVDDNDAVTEHESGLKRVCEALPVFISDGKTVGDDLDRMALVLVEVDGFIELAHLTIDARSCEPITQQEFQNLTVFSLFVLHHGSEYRDVRLFGKPHHLIDDFLHGLLGDLLAALRAVRGSHSCEHEPQVIEDLGDRSHSRTGILARRFLVDRNRRRQAVDVIHVRLLHLTKKLPGVSGQRFHVLSLSFGIDGIKGQR